MMRKLVAAASLLFVSAPAPPARAQLPSVDARTFQPSTDPAASLSVEPVATAPKWRFGTAAYLHYSYRPVTVRRGETDVVDSRPVEHVMGGDFVANLGLGGPSVGVALPYVVAQTGDKRLDPRISATDRAPLSAIGDLSLEAKAPFVTYDTAGFALGMRGRLTLPTGERTSFIGSGTTSVELRVLAEYSLLVVSAHASLGYVSRFDQVTWPATTGATIGDAIPWAAGLRLRPKLLGLDSGDRQLWEIAARGSLPAGPVGPFGSGDPGSAQLSSAVLGVSDRIGLGETRELYVIAGADVGLTSALGVPAVRGIVGIGWMPRENDLDRDKVRDDRDQCPEIAEDRDGFEDDDGCPEIDDDDDGVIDKEDACPRERGVEAPGPRNGCPAADGARDTAPASDRDGDGILDPADRCPLEPEDKDGNADNDGCPDLDDDGDGVVDREDACPKERGDPSSDPTRNGCPVQDRDGDSFFDTDDKCPDVAEVFNGVTDDGCPDQGGAPLVRVETRAAKTTLVLARPLKLAPTTQELPAASATLLRAVALELSRRRDLSLTIGVRPASTKESDVTAAQAQALMLSRLVRDFTHRESSADVVAWDAVKGEPGAQASGVGLGVVVAPPPPKP